jgi:hypothetical protein
MVRPALRDANVRAPDQRHEYAPLQGGPHSVNEQENSKTNWCLRGKMRQIVFEGFRPFLTATGYREFTRD